MSIQALSRYGAFLLLAAVVAGCSSSKSDTAAVSRDARVVSPSHECLSNRSNCIYKGRYEPGERDYAEDEARRLNQASIERLQRIR